MRGRSGSSRYPRPFRYSAQSSIGLWYVAISSGGPTTCCSSPTAGSSRYLRRHSDALSATMEAVTAFPHDPIAEARTATPRRRASITPAALDAAYREQLEAALARRRVVPHRNPSQTRAMLAWMKTHAGGRLDASEVGRTWIWSDLHLDHAEVVWCFNRPFRTSQAMCRALVEAWRESVKKSDRIICLGDITVGVANRGIDTALATLPGTRILVVGNHEFPIGGAGVKDYGFEAVYPTLVCETDPPLLLTHEPLDELPVGAVNVHGHLHGTEAREIARCSRHHLNVNVELTAFRPVRLSELVAAARALLAGNVEPEMTTADTIAAALELRAKRRGRPAATAETMW